LRQITIEDLHRLILAQADDPEALNPWRDKDPSIKDRMRLLVTDEVENRIVSSIIGSLTFRNREQIRRLLNRLAQWPTPGAPRELDLIDYWSKIGAKYFDFVETFYIKPELFETWRRQMHALDEDLPALAWLSSEAAKPYRSRASHDIDLLNQWPTFIRGNDPQLHRDLARGYGCLHLHLSGAYPAPYFWIGLMNRRFDEKKLLDRAIPKALHGYRTPEDLHKIVKLIELARVARSKLWRYVQGRTDAGALRRNFEDCGFLVTATEEDFGQSPGATDRAQSDVQGWGDAVCPSLIGERYLLLRILQVIRTAEEPRIYGPLSRIFWAYIVAKHSFLATFQQAEGIAGFDYFEHTFRLSNWRNSASEQRCAEEIGDYLQESGSLVKLELMIAPKEKAEDYKAEISLAGIIRERLKKRQSKALLLQAGEPRVGLIVHFIKDEGEPLAERLTGDKNALRAYHHAARDRAEKQFEQLLKALEENSDGVSICGIDTANRELYCPPEVFAELFRRATPALRRRVGSRFKTVGRTFHVGEDFAHLATGLRRIYEALVFLDLRPGDRLGHACALALDPERWIRVNPTIEMHLIDVLDDALFEAMLLRDHQVRTGAIDERVVGSVLRTIDESCVEIFGTTIPFVQLEKAWRMRASVSRNNAPDFGSEESVPQWIRRQHEQGQSVPIEEGGAHSVIPQVRELVREKEHLPTDVAERIALEYQHDIRTIRRFLRIKTIDTTRMVERLRKLQDCVTEEANQRGIVIESNPSSNWLIGGLESHSEIPAVRWLTASGGANERPRVAFTINPDDPAVFANSIENEYFMVFAAAVHSTRAMSRVDCLRELSEIRERSLQASFLD
jgi:adenosine deaminase